MNTESEKATHADTPVNDPTGVFERFPKAKITWITVRDAHHDVFIKRVAVWHPLVILAVFILIDIGFGAQHPRDDHAVVVVFGFIALMLFYSVLHLYTLGYKLKELRTAKWDLARSVKYFVEQYGVDPKEIWPSPEWVSTYEANVKKDRARRNPR